MYDFFFAPCIEHLFLKRAMVACMALALGAGPVGVFLVLRRMSLLGDALSHSILPGVAIGFFISGLSLTVMSLGGFIMGLVVALLAGVVSRVTQLREDASFAGFFLISLALGVTLVSMKGSNVDLLHILFGTILAVNVDALLLVAGVATLTLIVLATIYRPLILECVDPNYFKSVSGAGGYYHIIFLMLVVANLVAAFQTLGTLMALGLMMLPAIGAKFWAKRVWSMILVSFLFASSSGYLGLLISVHAGYPSGPSIILVAGVLYILSLLVGTQGSLRTLRAGKRPASPKIS